MIVFEWYTRLVIYTLANFAIENSSSIIRKMKFVYVALHCRQTLLSVCTPIM